MQRCAHAAKAILILALSAGCVSGDLNNGDDSPEDGVTADRGHQDLTSIKQVLHKKVCADATPGTARCHAHVRVDAKGMAVPFATPSGFGPADIKSAYNIPSTGFAGTVAVVDAYDYTTAESDLAVYRSTYGLPACTTANGCFKKVGQTGSTTSLPPKDTTGWSEEEALDLDMVSAACPNCKIILVEVNSPTTANLGAGVNVAASLGANAISNSYGGSEDSTVTSAETYYNHPGIMVTASAGDSDYGAEYPATSANVLAVGGTALVKNTGTARGWTESVWNTTAGSEGTGSGCSAYITKPSWQNDATCKKRMEADVSAVADPATGVAVYDTATNSDGINGWAQFGGTSAASPLVAAMMVWSGQYAQGPSFPWKNTADFYDVTTGNNGTCTTKYYCTAGAGYDGPTGWGTPNTAAIAGTTGTGGGGGGTGGGGTGGGGGGTGGGGGGTGGGGGGTGGGGGGTGGGGGGVGGGGGGTGTCSHSECTVGKKLTSGCDTCVTKICKSDSYCCKTTWDSVCVGEVQSICGESCGGGGGGGGGTGGGGGGSSCSHSECKSGSALTSGCDSCVTNVCAADSYCCTWAWDSICVSEVADYCSSPTCN